MCWSFVLVFFSLFPPCLFLLRLWQIDRQNTPLTLLPTHSEEVNKRKQGSQPSLAASLLPGVSPTPHPSPSRRIISSEIQLPLWTHIPLRAHFQSLNKTFSQWDFSKPIWVDLEPLIGCFRYCLAYICHLKGPFSTTSLKLHSSSVVPFLFRQTYKLKWTASFDTMISNFVWVKQAYLNI